MNSSPKSTIVPRGTRIDRKQPKEYMSMMHVAEPTEFGFLKELPKREKSRLGKVWDRLKAVRAAIEEKGALVPAVFASKLLDVSKQRVDALMKDGRLERVELDGHPFITERSIVAYASSERKTGRPLKLPETKREMWEAAKGVALVSVGREKE
jgi:hypothetical protein